MSRLHERLTAELDRLDPHRVTTLGKVTAAVIDLHKPVPATASNGRVMWHDCKGCDPGAHAEWDASWPCSTIETIARELHIEVTERD